MAFVSVAIMSPAGTKSFVTGATGFLGRRLCKHLQATGEHVIASGRSQQQGPWDEFVEADLESEDLPTGFPEGVTTVYHLASKAHALSETEAESDSYKPVIVDGTSKVVDAAEASHVQRLIYVSSVKAMGEGNPPGIPLSIFDESSNADPQTPYGIAKAEAELIVLGSKIPHVVVLRPTMVFGPGEKGNLPRMIRAVERGRFPPLPDTGNRRSMIHVDDVVEFAYRAATKPVAAGKSYILAHPEALSTRELYDAIRKSLGLGTKGVSVPLILLKTAASIGTLVGKVVGKRLPLDLETLHKLTGSAWYSSALVEKELGYCAQYSVRDWLEK
ncbi:MAG: NAD-dependent epimerase/dehydratase family protein [Puniceicoccaceae bacterium]